ncbi:hypothetical protein SNEBB_004703 [Seison nebaliae]|nr:hypothetical protein SNEBB_004703 [Seison nebaliae]
MDLETNYTYSLMDDRWQILDDMGMGSKAKVRGFSNPSTMGVCLTNVIMGMITSSVNLMNLIKCRQKDCPTNLTYQNKQIRNFLCADNAEILSLTVGLSDILVKGLCDVVTEKNNSKLGVAIDYYLLKSIRDHHVIDYSLGSAEMICTHLVQSIKYSTSIDYPRWNNIVKDLLNSNSVEQESYPFHLNWFSKIRMLNLQALLPGIEYNPADIRPLLPNYLYMFEKNDVYQLNERLSKLKIDPSIITISFGAVSISRLHNRFYYDFIQLLNRTYQLNVSYNLRHLNVYYYLQSISMPSLKPNNNTKYTFTVNKTEKIFTLKGISILLMEENVIKLNEIGQPIKLLPKIEKLSKNCQDDMIIHINNLLLERNLTTLLRLMEINIRTIKLQFNKICTFLMTKARRTYSDNHGVHGIGLISRNEQWILMNDNNSFVINDIGNFSHMLKDESVNSVLLEEELEEREESFKHFMSQKKLITLNNSL